MRYKVTPKRQKMVDGEWDGDSYIPSSSTTWPFEWLANLHLKYLICIGYDCVLIEDKTFKGEGNE
jgi:hypothetical protein